MRLFSFPEAADHCGVNVKTLRKHAKEGFLATVATPLGVRVTEESLSPYLKAKMGQDEPEETKVDQDAPRQTHWDQAKTHQDAPLQTKAAQVELNQTAPVETKMDQGAPGTTNVGQAALIHDAPLETTIDQSGPGRHTTSHQVPPSQTRVDLSEGVPLQAHLAALKLIETALEKAEKAEAKAEEHRSRAEHAERRHLALELQLRQYQMALADQAESLAEAQALKQAAELQLNSVHLATEPFEPEVKKPDLPLRVSTSKPSFGRRLKKWLGFSEAM